MLVILVRAECELARGLLNLPARGLLRLAENQLTPSLTFSKADRQTPGVGRLGRVGPGSLSLESLVLPDGDKNCKMTFFKPWLILVLFRAFGITLFSL